MKRFASLFAWIFVAFAGHALAAGSSNVVKTEHVTAQLVAERLQAVRGEPVAVALRLRHIPGWHTYWRNPGDSGLPTTIRWTLPADVKAGDIQWPTPQRIPFGPLTNFGYEGEVWLVSNIYVPSGYRAPSVKLRAKADWLVCEEICVPESGEFTLTLPVVAAGTKPRMNPDAAEGFASTRGAYPRDNVDWRFEARATSGGAVLSFAPPAGEAMGKMYFLPYLEGQIEPSAPQALAHEDGRYMLSLPRAEQPTASLERLHGILVIEQPNGARSIEVDAPVAAGTALSMGLIVAVVFAFLGGIILNAMPCVFPVLSIKVLGFAHERSASRARRHGLVYGIGVIVSFWLLAALLLGLRAFGEQVGWGFQLQSPAVVMALALLFFLLALNLVGVFEVGQILPSSVTSARAKRPHVDAFLSGVLAVAVASPCTAPFMGAALGYAVTQSNAESFLVFTALGTGMALPYMLLAWFPRVRRMLPKPGAWMERLKQFLAFPLFATVVWLVWVLGSQRGIDAAAGVLLALLLVAFALWLGRGYRNGKRNYVSRVSAITASVGALALGVWAAQRPIASPQPVFGEWQPYSEQAVQALNEQGRTVFVDFTAAWCVTCQVNKQLVLDTDVVRKAFAENGIATLRADWTNNDPQITRALNELGRSGVPVYWIQRPGEAPQLLPELLTKDIVLDALSVARR